MKNLLHRSGAVLLLSFAIGASAADEPLTPAVKSAVLDGVVARLESTYVDTEAAPRIVKALRARQEARAYDGVTNPAQFGEIVGAHWLRDHGKDQESAEQAMRKTHRSMIHCFG